MEDEDLVRTVAANVRAARARVGWTQQKLSDESGIPKAHISRLESGKHFATLKTLNKVAKALKMEPDELLKPLPKKGKK